MQVHARYSSGSSSASFTVRIATHRKRAMFRSIAGLRERREAAISILSGTH